MSDFPPKAANKDEKRSGINVADIKLSDIDIGPDRARSLDPAWAEGLAGIITEQGMINAITVTPAGERFRLVTGLHRLEAHRMLGREDIRARLSAATSDDEARLEEVMENLGHSDLNALDRCHHLFELKQVYERLHPETRNGGDRGNQHTGGRTQKLRSASEDTEIFGFVAATAEKIGLSRRSIELAVKIWKDLSADSRKRCAGTWLAQRQSGLKELSEQVPANQAKILDMLFGDETPGVSTVGVSTVADAVKALENGVALTPMEKKLGQVRKAIRSLPTPLVDARLAELKESIATLSRFLAKLEDGELDAVVEEHEERIIASLKRRGRI